MIFLRSLLFNALFFTSTALTILFVLPMTYLLGRGFSWTVGRYWAGLVVRLLRIVCGIEVKVSGLENLPEGACIIASKHQSAFDTIVWLLFVPRCTYVLKQELMKIPLYGRQAARMGMIPVDRAGGGTALKGMVRATTAALANGRQIVIFPEGTRVEPGETGSYQPGVVAIANAAKGVPVIPVATNSGTCWGRRLLHRPPGVIAIRILPALPTGLAKAQMLAAIQGAIEPATAELEARYPAAG